MPMCPARGTAGSGWNVMAKVKIELISGGIVEMLKSEGLASICEAEAARMTRATGMDYVPDVHIGRTRVNAGGYQEGDEEK